MQFDSLSVRAIARLARLRIPEERENKFIQELDGILNWVNQLQEVDIQNIEPLYSVSAQETVLRSDSAVIQNLQTALMENAPKSVHGFYVVPKMVE